MVINNIITTKFTKCFICGQELVLEKTDDPQQGVCSVCGCAYKKSGSYKKEYLDSIGVKHRDVKYPHPDLASVQLHDLFSEYWEKTGKRIPDGFFLKNLPYTLEEHYEFWKFVYKKRKTHRVSIVDYNLLRRYLKEYKNEQR